MASRLRAANAAPGLRLPPYSPSVKVCTYFSITDRC
jgi:hypothetical protein